MATAKLVPYRGRGAGGALRWRVVSPSNGKKISVSSEGYVRPSDRRKSIRLTMEACARWLRDNPGA